MQAFARVGRRNAKFRSSVGKDIRCALFLERKAVALRWYLESCTGNQSYIVDVWCLREQYAGQRFARKCDEESQPCRNIVLAYAYCSTCHQACCTSGQCLLARSCYPVLSVVGPIGDEVCRTIVPDHGFGLLVAAAVNEAGHAQTHCGACYTNAQHSHSRKVGLAR